MKYLAALVIFLGCSLFFAPAAFGQRDFLTEQEVELIRDAQEIDRRIEVLTHAIDRRLHVLGVGSSGVKIKTNSDWGPLPEGDRSQLFLDIRRLLQKAVDDIDSLAERPESAILPEPGTRKKGESDYATLFPKAVRSLSGAAARYVPILEAQLEAEREQSVQGSILTSLDLCREIIASVVKLPAEALKKSGKKT